MHPVFWQRCPYPTVGRPIGSGAGEATKPSNDLINDTVAEFTTGTGQAELAGRQHLKPDGPGQSPMGEWILVRVPVWLCNELNHDEKKILT